MAVIMERLSRARAVQRKNSYPYAKWNCMLCRLEIRRRQMYRALPFGRDKVGRCHDECYKSKSSEGVNHETEKQQISLS
jgi:hypothetical protein